MFKYLLLYERIDVYCLRSICIQIKNETTYRVKETRFIGRAAEPAVTGVESVLSPPTRPSILQKIGNAITKIP